VPWRSDFSFPDPGTGQNRAGWFRCPCHASTFTDGGVRVYGPAPRSLDRFDVAIAGNNVYVDISKLRLGTNENPKFAVDPDARV
jgi:Rieske Fe-S protein